MRFGADIIHLDQVESTNDYLEEIVKSGSANEGVLYIARTQTKGRGQADNSWESEPGQNLTFSFVVYPGFLSAAQQFAFNKTIALAVRDFVKELVPVRVTVKWPNDIYAGNGKIAGMLFLNNVQGNRIHSIITGIGLNVNQEVFRSDAPNPVSLKNITGKSYDLDELANKLCTFLDFRYQQLLTESFDLIDRDYLGALYRLGEWKPYSYFGKSITAKISGVSDFGRLELVTESGDPISCDIKDIIFLPG